MNGETAQELELRKRAEGLLGSLRGKATSLSQPYYVEFAGTPKSGKSSCIDIVNHFFNRMGFQVHAPTEGASKRTPYYLKRDLVAYNGWCASYALSHVLEGVYGSDRFDLAILDRGLFDSLAWFELLATQGNISKRDRDVIQRFLMFGQWRSHIRQVFLFKADHGTSLVREYEHKLIDEPGIAMSPGFLASLNEAYDAIEERYGALIPDLYRIDTSAAKTTTPHSTALEVATHIVSLMETEVTRHAE